MAAAHAQTRPAAAPASPPAPATTGTPRDEAKENEGKLAATGWLTLLDRRDWGTAWERSSAVFRRNVPLGTWMDNIPKLRDPFGPLQQRDVVDAVHRTTLPGHPEGDYVTVFFASRFERKADAKETVTTMRESDGRWRVTGYSAQ